MGKGLKNVRFPIWSAVDSQSVQPLRDHIEPRLQNISAVTIDGEWCFPHMSNPSWRMYFNLDDGAWAKQGRTILPFKAGNIYFIPPWLDWACGCSGQVRHVHAYFRVAALAGEVVRGLFPMIVTAPDPDARLAAKLEYLATELAGGHHALRSSNVAAMALREGFAALLENLAPGSYKQLEGLVASSKLRQRLVAFEENLTIKLSCDQLAARLGCSKPEMTRRFRAELGTSPARWLRGRRLELSCDLLSRTELRIDDVAERCGFSDRFQFTRAFSRQFQVSPGRWRQSNRVRI